MTKKEIKECKEYWGSMIYTRGKLDEKKVLAELYDYMTALNNVPLVYERVTGGLLSKINYPAQTVIAAYEDDISKCYVDKDDLRSLLS
jgi:hypothetical protein